MWGTAVAAALGGACLMLSCAAAIGASAAPPPPAVDADRYWVASGESVQLSGAKQADAAVTVSVDGTVACDLPSDPATSWSCAVDATGLATGDYPLAVVQADATGASMPTDALLSVRRYAAPTVTPPAGVVTTDFVLSGIADPSALGIIEVFVAGDEFTSPLCSASVGGGGAWSCTIPFGALTGPTTRLVAYEYSLLALLDPYRYSEGAGVDILADPYRFPAPPPVITSPAAGSTVPFAAQPLSIAGTGGLSSGAATVVIDVSYWTGSAYSPLCSTVVTGPGWSCAATVTLPAGPQSIIASQVTSGQPATAGDAVAFTVAAAPVVPPVTPGVTPVAPRVPDPRPSPTTPAATPVSPPAATPRSTPAPAPATVPDDSTEQPVVETIPFPEPPPRNHPGSPTALTGSLNPISVVLENPLIAAASTAAALVLTLVVILPAELVGSAFTEQNGFFARLWGRRSRVRAFSARLHGWVDRHRFIAGALATLVTAVVFSWVDPAFGVDLASARLVLSCAIALLIIGYLVTAVSGLVSRARWGVALRVTVHPVGVFVAVVGVAASRVLDFVPGFLLGAVLGMAIVGRAAAGIVARIMLLRSGALLLVSLAAWIASTAIAPGDPNEPGAFWAALLSDAMVATATGGLTALLIGLLPFSPLEGAPIFEHSKPLWAASYVTAVAAFCVVVLPRADNWLNVGDAFVTWVVIAAIFVVACAAFFLVFHLWNRRPSPTPEDARPMSRSVTGAP